MTPPFAHEMIQARAKVKNRLGIHARPAAFLVRAASEFQSEITLAKDGLEVNGKSIMGVMMLAAETGAEIVVKAEGADEAQAVARLASMIAGDFD